MRRNLEQKKWLQTDGYNDLYGYVQFVQYIEKDVYRVIEHTCYEGLSGDGQVEYELWDTEVDLSDYSMGEMMAYLSAYGYEKRQNPQIEAECVAETDGNAVMYTENFEEILKYEREAGIKHEEFFKNMKAKCC